MADDWDPDAPFEFGTPEAVRRELYPILVGRRDPHRLYEPLWHRHRRIDPDYGEFGDCQWAVTVWPNSRYL